MGFLISINGADFSSYKKPITPPHRYSYVSDPEALWSTDKVNKDTPESSFSQHLKKATPTPAQKSFKKIEKSQHLSHKAVIAKHIMSTEVVTINSESPLKDAKHLMAEHGFRHLPVVDKNSKLVGMISDRDILKHPENEFVHQSMAQKVYAATHDTLIYEVAHLMLDEKISALPILGDDQKLIGVLTTTDILKGLIKRAPLELWI